MRIGLLAPISHPIPPPGYGPWERVAYEEAEGLVELGHEVTLFAPEGTKTSANLVATVPHSLDQAGVDARTTEEAHIFTAVDRVYRRRDRRSPLPSSCPCPRFRPPPPSPLDLHPPRGRLGPCNPPAAPALRL